MLQEGGIRFQIPSLPSSCNSIYQMIPSRRMVILRPEVRLWKSQAKEYVPRLGDVKGFLDVRCTLHYCFYYKNGSVRKFDTQNMLKVLCDVISEKCGVDDSRFKKGSWDSIHSEDEKVSVEIREVISEA